jgi:hypothetical protein
MSGFVSGNQANKSNQTLPRHKIQHELMLIARNWQKFGSLPRVPAQGLRTPDIYSEGTTKVGTREMGDAVVKALV